MALHTDIPTATDIERIASARDEYCVSIYVPTSPVTPEAEASRLELRSAAEKAAEQLLAAGASRDDIETITGHLDDLTGDLRFWTYLSHSLAVFLTRDDIVTFRLPNRLTASVQVSDRFHIKPLLRTVTFPHTAFVLALSQKSARLVEVTADSPGFEVATSSLPTSLDEAVGEIDDADYTSSFDRMPAGDQQRVRLTEYARRVDRYVRPVISGGERPLILAAAEPLASIYRSISSIPNLVGPGINGNPDNMDSDDLSRAARFVLDEVYGEEIAAVREDLMENHPRDRVAYDTAYIARAVTFGAVETLLVDIDAYEPGYIDETDGAITFGESEDRYTYAVNDEIARRALRTGARVLAVRAEDIPNGRDVAALLRYAV